MSTESLIAGVPVLLIGVMMCLMPAFTQPTLQFGVRLPRERVGAPVIRRERRAYQWRTAGLAVAAVAAVGFTAGSVWLTPVVVLLELVAGVGFFWMARERITAVKREEGWFDGLRQTVAVDTGWRTEPQRFPVMWLLPAVAVVIATAVVGIVRYPGLPTRLAVHFSASGAADGWAHKSVWSAFSMVGGQILTTALIAGLLLLVHRSRPDTDAADVAGSTSRYRTFLGTMGRALLVCAAMADISLMLSAFTVWRIYRLTGSAAALTILPAVVGGLALVIVSLRMGQAGSRLGGAGDAATTDRVNRDDDRYWKAGLFYVNREDPAVMVGKRFGIGWTINFGNPKAWLLTLGIAAAVIAGVVAR